MPTRCTGVEYVAAPPELRHFQDVTACVRAAVADLGGDIFVDAGIPLDAGLSDIRYTPRRVEVGKSARRVVARKIRPELDSQASGLDMAARV